MLKEQLAPALLEALHQQKAEWAPELELEAWQGLLSEQFRLERPRHAEHGDYSINVSFLARYAKRPPKTIAEGFQAALVARSSPTTVQACQALEVAGGFVNVRLSQQQLCEALLAGLRSEQPGANTSQAGTRLLLEFVSANPTGPLHLGHGRWAALGDSVRRILQANGAQVDCEFYVNDFGQQMNNLANSLWFRCLEQLGLGQLPPPVEGEKYPYYPGEYVVELAKAFLAEPGSNHEAWIREHCAQVGAVRLEADSAPYLERLKTYGRDAMLALQKSLLERFKTHFDHWTLETELHANKQVEPVLEQLKASGYTEEREGALWLKSSLLGDEKDRVLVKSDGHYTYLAADVAYHGIKFSRKTERGQLAYNRLVNIWGADHHGYVARMKAAITALGYQAEQFDVILGQLVNLKVNGEKARMGKRSKMLTLDDVINEVGVDATRFWLVSRSADHTIEFDLDLAASASDDNPVFYAQYAHARACSIERMVSSERAEVPISEAHIADYLASVEAETVEAHLWGSLTEGLDEEEATRAQATLRELLLHLDSFEERVVDAGRLMAPHLIARYVLDLATLFHSFYNTCRVLTPVPERTLARLSVVVAVQRTLKAGLALLGVSAPESM